MAQQDPWTVVSVTDSKSSDSTPPTSPQSQGFWSSAWRAVNPIPGFKLAANVAADVGTAEATHDPSKLVDAGKKLWQGVVEPQYEMVLKGNQSFAHGRPVEGIDYYAASVLPGVGPNIMHGYEQLQSGNVRGAAGTWSGILGSAALPEGMRLASKPIRGLAAGAYGSPLEIMSDKTAKSAEGMQSIASERQQVRERGLGRETTGATPPDRPTRATQKGLKGLESRISETKRSQMSKIKEATDQGVVFDLRQVLQPVSDLARSWTREGASSELGVKLSEQVNNFIEDHYDGISGFSATPSELQRFKEVTDDQIHSWGKDAGDTTGGEAYRREFRTAVDKTLDTIPDVKQLNWAMHLDKSLQKAIVEALTKPHSYRQFARDMTETGILYTLGIDSGHPMLAKAAAIGAAAQITNMAMRSPRLMTTLGVALDQAGVAVPATLKTAAVTGAALHQTNAPPPGARITVKSADELIKQWQTESNGSGKQ